MTTTEPVRGPNCWEVVNPDDRLSERRFCGYLRGHVGEHECGMGEFGPCPYGRGIYTTGTCHQPQHHEGGHVFEYPNPRPAYRSCEEAAEVEGRLFGTHPSWFGVS